VIIRAYNRQKSRRYIVSTWRFCHSIFPYNLDRRYLAHTRQPEESEAQRNFLLLSTATYALFTFLNDASFADLLLLWVVPDINAKAGSDGVFGFNEFVSFSPSANKSSSLPLFPAARACCGNNDEVGAWVL
jgi:hypothetical protein